MRSTVPLPGGAVTVIEVSLFTLGVFDVVCVSTNLTIVAPVNPVPVIMMTVPPLGDPVVGASQVFHYWARGIAGFGMNGLHSP